VEPTSAIMYDFWQFMYFGSIFTAIVAYFSYMSGQKTGYSIGYKDLFDQLVREGVIEYVENENDENDEPWDGDIY
jgi:hypothetical protein